MKSSNAFIFGRVAALSGLLALGGCGAGSDDDHAEMSTATDLTVTLKGAQTIPTSTVMRAAPTESGTATLKFDSAAATNLTGSLTTALTGVTFVHLHRGYAGQDGPPITTMDPVNSAYPLNTGLSLDDIARFKAGGLYLNVHSGTDGATQIRGQILPAGLKVYRADLVAVTGVTTTATGVAAITVNQSSGDFTSYITVKGLTNTFKFAHVHYSSVFVVTYAADSSVADGTVYKASGILSRADLDLLKSNTLYVNVHTEQNGAGEIKGTLVGE